MQPLWLTPLMLLSLMLHLAIVLTWLLVTGLEAWARTLPLMLPLLLLGGPVAARLANRARRSPR